MTLRRREPARAQAAAHEDDRAVGVARDREADRARTLLRPAIREPEHDERGSGCRFDETVGAGGDEHRLGVDAEGALQHERGAREETAGVAPA